jgi:hypothetical protein
LMLLYCSAVFKDVEFIATCSIFEA